MSNVVYRSPESVGSTAAALDRFFSIESSIEDEEMLDTPESDRLPSPTSSSPETDLSHRSTYPESLDLYPSPVDRQLIDPALMSNRSDSGSSSLTMPGSVSRKELEAKGWFFPPSFPLKILKYAIGRRELAMQTQIEQHFDLVNPEPYTYPPVHTCETEKLKAWHNLVTRNPAYLPKKKGEAWPEIKLAWGPLGWDQVWAYRYIDSKLIYQNASNDYWWLRRFEDHQIWALLHRNLEIYGAEVKFPYGYDTTIPDINKTDTEKIIRIPANEGVMISLGKDVAEWARQVSFRGEYWQEGPEFPVSFDLHDRTQEIPTITLRFKNIHPELPTTIVNPDDKGQWAKGWLMLEEVTLLSGETDTTFLDTIISGGPRPDPTRSNRTNRSKLLRFWDLEANMVDVTEWYVNLDWIRDKWHVDSNDRHAIEMLREGIEARLHESVQRVIRDTPF